MRKIMLFLFLGMVLQADAQVDLEMGLQAFYPFSGNANDASGNGYHGTVIGATLTENRAGISNSAYSFSGGDYFIEIGDVMNDVFAGVGNQFTISAWIKPDTVMSNSIILGKTADAACGEDQRQFFLRLFADQNLSFTYYSANVSLFARRVLSSSQLLDLNNWHHVLVMYDGTIDTNNGIDRVTMHIKCTEEFTTLETATGTLGNIQTGTSPIGIGNYFVSHGGISCNPERAFEGNIDDIRIYNRLLTADEISVLCSELPVSVDNPVTTLSDYNIFPNPAQNYLYIDTNDYSDFEIFNSQGKIVARENLVEKNFIGHLPSGVYFIRLLGPSQVSGAKKIVVMKDKKP
ncbi:MAG: LamG-like jellyroll fold domain-containing protein [Bacteroidota bacterium]